MGRRGSSSSGIGRRSSGKEETWMEWKWNGEMEKRRKGHTSIAKNWTLVTKIVLSSPYSFSESFRTKVPKL